ncbi:MAG TPA: DUF1501 domain-containing protein [Pirellulales bacterium]|nr:DUF1501 domain-containing protein [Pirellulales bacterium]
MLNLLGSGARLCDGIRRREILRAGSLGFLGFGSGLGLTLPDLFRGREARANSAPSSDGNGRAKSCIILFLMGGPPQHSTWDPKPEAPAEVRGEFEPIPTVVPGMDICGLMPLTAKVADKVCVLRAVSSGDNAHSSSGYYMLTGQPHQPLNVENANPGAPNDYPSLGTIVRHLRGDSPGLPGAVTLPMRIANTDGSVWPGQDAGFLGRAADPWLLKLDPSVGTPRVDEFNLPPEIPPVRLAARRSLLEQVNQRLAQVDAAGSMQQFGRHEERALNLLSSSSARNAFDLERERSEVRDRYGRTPFGQSVLLARRLVEAGVSLVQVNWYRGPDEPSANPVWDTHRDEAARLKTVLMPPMDQAYSALLEDLSLRGMLNETLVVQMGEFGRSPKIDAAGGRGHWGYVYSAALAGGGVRGGQVIGASDSMGGQPKDRRVSPADLAATIFHGIGYSPDTLYHDRFARPLPISRGEVIQGVF